MGYLMHMKSKAVKPTNQKEKSKSQGAQLKSLLSSSAGGEKGLKKIASGLLAPTNHNSTANVVATSIKHITTPGGVPMAIENKVIKKTKTKSKVTKKTMTKGKVTKKTKTKSKTKI